MRKGIELKTVDCFLDFIKRGMEMRRTSFVSDSIIEFICMCYKCLPLRTGWEKKRQISSVLVYIHAQFEAQKKLLSWRYKNEGHLYVN